MPAGCSKDSVGKQFGPKCQAYAMGEKPDCDARRALEVPGYSRWKPFGLACDLLSGVLLGS